ncbi:cysteine desulfurase-like protein [Nocardioides anomalus]|uniref:Cysteine desulfurase-like protein n=1 Tax=Nocardioides anomalus TaxID=2712223 RepID=A0A6G6WEP5_9ACTN|nr:cysteine desulfurase-like protein [Nocardioides anomalus]QIG43676.1 cysteine desulfurase-like protein [Nocardioides anomalus]
MAEQQYDVAKVRAHFPALESGLAFFDGPGGSQTPRPVADAMHATMLGPLSNRGDLTLAQQNAERAVTEARAALADLLDATPEGVVFGRSFTQLTFDLSRTLAKGWGAGDEVVVSRLDHDGNVRPWVIAAEAAGATVRWIDFDPGSGELSLDSLEEALSERTRLVAVTGASNLIGTRPDLRAVADRVHRTDAWLYVDAVHLTAHAAVSLAQDGMDLVGCSTYKFLGPHAGVLAAAPDLLEQLHPDKLLPSTDRVPERFELGTLPYELMAGAGAAVEFLAGLAPGAAGTRRERLVASLAALEEHEDRLRTRIEDGLRALPGATVHSRAARRTPTVLVTFADRDPQEVSRHLATRGVNAPAGSFYAYEPARRLGLGEAGGLRVGLAPYSDDSDVDRLLEALGELFPG